MFLVKDLAFDRKNVSVNPSKFNWDCTDSCGWNLLS